MFHYFAAQYLGAFVAAFVTWGVYHDAVHKAYPGDNNTDGLMAIYGTFLQDGVGIGTAVLGNAKLSSLTRSRHC